LAPEWLGKTLAKVSSAAKLAGLSAQLSGRVLESSSLAALWVKVSEGVSGNVLVCGLLVVV
jgi:hypothetical protein